MTPNESHVFACQLATSNSVKQHKLRKRIAWLSEKKSILKVFISLYIPPNMSIFDVRQSLKNEFESSFSDLLSSKMGLNAAKKMIIQHLEQLQEIPLNGLALFAGNVESNSQQSVNVEEIIPPEPITRYSVEIDDHFRLEQLRSLLRDQRTIGLMIVDAKSSYFGLLRAGQIELIKEISSGVHGKSGKGGQSQRRYERERKMELSDYFHRVAEHAKKAFIENSKINALLVGGPGNTKNDFLKGEYLHYELSNAILNVADTQCIDQSGLRELVSKSSESLEMMCQPEEKQVMERLTVELAKDGLATYGLDSVSNSLQAGKVDIVIISDNTGLVEVSAECKNCGYKKTEIDSSSLESIRRFLSTACQNCGAISYTFMEKDLVDVFEDLASKSDARVEVISTESVEKAKLNTIGGIAALLRYK
jgi:peptide chain release factor subunit 1